MTDQTIIHNTITLERAYPADPARVFAAWADAAAKARWFAGPEVEHELDFRVGGLEIVRRPAGGGLPALRFEAVYRDIVPDLRIVFAGTLFAGAHTATISLTSVQFHADGAGTKLELIEHGAFLDGHEQPSWRERGLGSQLDALGVELRGDR